MSFFRRFSLAAANSEHNNTFPMEHPDEDRLDELNKNYVRRDAEEFGPQLVKDVEWKTFNERVLDFGCGSGKVGFTHFLPQVYLHDSHLYSADVSESMVSYASIKYAHPSATYAHGDVMSDNFPYKYLKFDKMFSIHYLQRVADHRAALQRLFDYLKPMGQLGLVFSTNSFCDFLDKHFSTEHKWKEYFDTSLVNNHSLDNQEPEEDNAETNLVKRYRGILESVGYEVLKLREETKEYTFSNLEKAVVYYMSTSPCVKRIPAEMQDPLEQECLDFMMKEFDLNDISVPYHTQYDCIYIVAKKAGFSTKNHHGKLRGLRSRLSLP